MSNWLSVYPMFLGDAEIIIFILISHINCSYLHQEDLLEVDTLLQTASKPCTTQIHFIDCKATNLKISLRLKS